MCHGSVSQIQQYQGFYRELSMQMRQNLRQKGNTISDNSRQAVHKGGIPEAREGPEALGFGGGLLLVGTFTGGILERERRA